MMRTYCLLRSRILHSWRVAVIVFALLEIVNVLARHLSGVRPVRPNANCVYASSGNVRNPERLPVDLDPLQSAIRQFFLCQSQKSEMRQVAKNRLEPTVLRQDVAD